MKTVRWFCAVAAVVLLTSAVPAQPPKPGAEHEVLKKLEGDWDLVMKFGGAESKGSMKYKMELGGLWLAGSLESELFGEKFQGKSLSTYDAGKKKYIEVWADSMGTQPMLMEGTYDKDKKTLTLAGEGPGMDGKPRPYKSVSTYTDDNTINFSMYVGDGKEPAITVVYTRKKK
ncbi:DUF1579 domain-containing protein [Frigoriglobus tundricola]|uniref:DUF1579 domain-containing protein n=1 Tax=Frigoriglobus tundricola TaxID=2774151 RepID=A0A6M5YRE6_9BACT|nr:DUF1579 domain-containing protein [Frigoriglobus tundricola]QJW95831.1 hypothetical protein FTUN_3385 [Frigoriglobus tundricola]